MKTRRRTSLAERFAAKLPATPSADACWVWQAGRNESGYGRINGGPDGPGILYAHRVSYELYVGPIPEGMNLDHLCRNRACVNPAHLEPVTQRENVRRGMAPTAIARRMGVCFRGRTVADDAYIYPRTGRAYCRQCKRERRAAGGS